MPYSGNLQQTNKFTNLRNCLKNTTISRLHLTWCQSMSFTNVIALSWEIEHCTSKEETSSWYPNMFCIIHIKSYIDIVDKCWYIFLKIVKNVSFFSIRHPSCNSFCILVVNIHFPKIRKNVQHFYRGSPLSLSGLGTGRKHIGFLATL